MSAPIYLYINIPLNFDNWETITDKVLTYLYNDDLYSQIKQINYAIIGGTNATFLNAVSIQNNNNTYMGKMNFLLENPTAVDTTDIMTNMFVYLAVNSGCYFNILFVNLYKILSVPDKNVQELWTNYLTYFHITHSNECISNLSNANVVGVDLYNSNIPYYLSDWWWTNSNYIHSLKYLSKKCTTNITDGTSGGLYVSIWTSINWTIDLSNGLKYINEKYKQSYQEFNITSISLNNGYIYKDLICFKKIEKELNVNPSIKKYNHVFPLNKFQNPFLPEPVYTKTEKQPCDYRRRLLDWNIYKKKKSQTPTNNIAML